MLLFFTLSNKGQQQLVHVPRPVRQRIDSGPHTYNKQPFFDMI